MAHEIDIFIYPDGTVNHLYQEAVDLSSLGPATITRASTVEPSVDSHEWEVRLPETAQLIAVAPTRSEALAKEIAILNTHILPQRHSGNDPLSLTL